MDQRIAALRDAVTICTQLLASRKIKVTQSGINAFVQYDPVSGQALRVNIPYIPDEATDEILCAIQGFLDHEVGHLIFSDAKVLIQAMKDGHGALHNVIEDTFVEREMAKKFAGSAYNLDRVSEFVTSKIVGPQVERLVKSGASVDPATMFLQGVGASAVRAWAGQKVHQDFMKDKWRFIQPIVDAVPPSLIQKIKTAKNSKETLEATLELHRVLTTATPPPAPSKEKQEGGKDSKDSKPGEGGGKGKDDKSEPKPGGKSEAGEPEKGKQESKPEPKPEQGKDEPTPEPEEGEGEQEGADGEQDEAEEQEGEEESKSEGGGEKDEAEEQEGEEESKSEGGGEKDAEEEEGNEEEAAGDSGAEPDEKEEAESESSEGEEPSEEEGEDETDAPSSSEGELGEEGEADSNTDAESYNTEPSEEEPQEAKPEEELEETGMERRPEAVGESHEAHAPKALFDPKQLEDIKGVEDLLSEEIQQKILDNYKGAEYLIHSADHDECAVPPESRTNVVRQDDVLRMEQSVEGMVGTMAKDLERVVLARSQVRHTPGYRSGKLSSSSVYRLKVGDTRIFRRKEFHESKETVFSLVVDCSGSMQNNGKIQVAMYAALALSSVLERLKIKHECVGFTTKPLPHEAALELTQTEQKIVAAMGKKRGSFGLVYNRREAIYMPVFKGFDERLTPDVRKRLLWGCTHLETRNNIDGESLEIAHKRLKAQPAKRHVMIVLSDGNPAAGAGFGLDEHLVKVVKEIEADKTSIIGIGILTDAVRAYYKRFLVLNSVEQLPGVVLSELRQHLLDGYLNAAA